MAAVPGGPGPAMPAVPHSSLYQVAKGYTDAIDTVVNPTSTITYGAAKGYKVTVDVASDIGSIVKDFGGAFAGTVSTSVELGVVGSVKEYTKWCTGLTDFSNGIEALKNHWNARKRPAIDPATRSPIIITDEPETVVTLRPKRNMATATGQMFGHFFKGIGKAVTVGVGSGMYAVGTLANGYDMVKASTDSTAKVARDPVLGACQAVASGVNTVGGVLLNGVVNTAGFVAAVAKDAVMNPGTTLQVGKGAVVVAGVGYCAYGASAEYLKASNAEGALGKIGHGAKALAYAAAGVVLPSWSYDLVSPESGSMVAKAGVATAGTGLLLYKASSEYVKSEDSEGMLGKIGHGALALGCLAAGVATPFLVFLSPYMMESQGNGTTPPELLQ